MIYTTMIFMLQAVVVSLSVFLIFLILMFMYSVVVNFKTVVDGANEKTEPAIKVAETQYAQSEHSYLEDTLNKLAKDQ